MGHQSGSQAGAVAMIIVSSALIAIVPNSSKLAYESGASVPFVIAARFVVTVLLLAAILIVQRRSFITTTRVLRLCLLGGIATAVMSFGVLSAITRIDISLVILIFYLHPMLIAWLGHLRGSYVLNRFRLCCCALILLGLALALSVDLERLDAWGVAMAGIGACAVTGLIVFNGEATKESGTLIVNFYTAVVAVVPAVAAALLIGPLHLPQTGLGWFGLLSTGILYCLGLALFFAGLRPLGMVRATMISVIEPLLGILVAMLLFGDRLSAVQWLGVAVVVAGLLLLEVPMEAANRFLGALRGRSRA